MSTPLPLSIRMHPADNVAIVANDGGLPAGTVMPGGLVLVDKVPQAHKVALVDIAEGGEVRRYNVVIGYALQADRKSTRLNSSHLVISYAVFCLKKKKEILMLHMLCLPPYLSALLYHSAM